jgi:hypothetical protein
MIMASVISSVDVGLAPGIAQANAPPRAINSKAAAASSGPLAAKDAATKFEPAQPRYTEFAKLAKADDQVSEIAKSVREADKALTKVDDAVKQLHNEVLNVVKNFPPFPQNDERAQYLMSINGLRKELQAMVVPAVKDGKEPVFYPREGKLPELDPKTASEQDLRDFADVLKQMEEGIKRGKTALSSAFEALPKKINQDLVIPLEGEAQAGDVSRTTGGALQRFAKPVLAEETALAALEQ